MPTTYHKIKHLGDPETKNIFKYDNDTIVVEEKCDGANFRFWKAHDKVVFGSRNVDNIKDGDNADQFRKGIDYIEARVDPSDLDPDVVYVGECMTKHSLEYDWDETPGFIGFDLIQPDNGNPLGFKFARQEFEELGLPFVPVLYEGTAKEFRDKNPQEFMEESEFRDGKPEGIVIKNYDRLNHFDRPLFAKIRTEKFKEKNEAKFGKKKMKGSGTKKIFNQYVTEGRIRKIVNKMVQDEGRELSRELMGDLIHRVAKDALDEHIIEIYEDRDIKEIDLGIFQKLVPDKCLSVLDDMIEEQMEGEKVEEA